MAITLGDAVVMLRGDDSPLRSALNNAEGLTRSVVSGIGGLTKDALTLGFKAAAAGATALAGALGASIKAAMDAEKVDAQLDAVLRSTAGAAGMSKEALVGLADGLSKVTTFEDEAIISGESILLTFTKIGKEVFPEATEVMLDMSQALGQDLKSSAIQLGKALNDPVQGITALQRVGVSFTEEQKKMVEAMVDAGDVMGAQKFILRELQTEFGGSARAAGQTFAGQLTILKNTLGNLAETIGMVFLPALTGIAKTINEKLASPQAQALINGLASALKNLFSGDIDGAISSFAGALAQVFGFERANEIYGFLMGVKTKAGEAFGFITTNVIPPLRDAVGTISTKMGELKTWLDTNGPTIMAGISSAWATFKDNVLTPLGEQVFLLGLKLNDIKLWIEVYGPGIMDKLTEAFNDVKDVVAPALQQAMFDLNSSFGSVKDWIDTNAPLMRSTWQTLMEGLTTDTGHAKVDIPNIWGELGGMLRMQSDDMMIDLGVKIRAGLQLLNGDWEGARRTLESGQEQHGANMNRAAELFMGIHNKLIGNKIVELKEDMGVKFQEVRQKITDKWNEIKGDLDGTLNEIKRVVSEFSLVGAGEALMDGMKQGIQNKVGELAQQARDAINAIIGAARERLGWHSPSTVFMEAGEAVSLGMAQGIWNKLPAVAQAANALVQTVAQAAAAAAAIWQDIPADFPTPGKGKGGIPPDLKDKVGVFIPPDTQPGQKPVGYHVTWPVNPWEFTQPDTKPGQKPEFYTVTKPTAGGGGRGGGGGGGGGGSGSGGKIIVDDFGDAARAVLATLAVAPVTATTDDLMRQMEFEARLRGGAR